MESGGGKGRNGANTCSKVLIILLFSKKKSREGGVGGRGGEGIKETRSVEGRRGFIIMFVNYYKE